jgi:hypothetical protein
MIPVDSLLYKIDQKLNKLSTNEHQRIQLEDKILALNEAQLKLIKEKVDGVPTPSGAGMDSTRKRYEDLQKLVENFEDHPLPLKETDKQLNKWVASLSKVSPAYMLYVDAYFLADKGKCKDHQIWINRDLLSHGDLQFVLRNVHYKPSFEYQETCTYVASDEIAIFTDGTFTPTTLYLSYLRYPKYIDKAGYVKLDGKDSIDQDCELKNYLEDELVDLAVQDLAGYIENAGAMNIAQSRIQKDE